MTEMTVSITSEDFAAVAKQWNEVWQRSPGQIPAEAAAVLQKIIAIFQRAAKAGWSLDELVGHFYMLPAQPIAAMYEAATSQQNEGGQR